MRRPGSYTAHDGLRWVVEVCRGMAYLHGLKGIRVTHRDLKLENILLSEGHAKVRQADPNPNPNLNPNPTHNPNPNPNPPL